MHTAYLLVPGLACVVLAGILGTPWIAGGAGIAGDVSAGLAFLGLVLVVTAIANSHLNDVREGYRSAGEE